MSETSSKFWNDVREAQKLLKPIEFSVIMFRCPDCILLNDFDYVLSEDKDSFYLNCPHCGYSKTIAKENK